MADSTSSLGEGIGASTHSPFARLRRATSVRISSPRPVWKVLYHGACASWRGPRCRLAGEDPEGFGSVSRERMAQAMKARRVYSVVYERDEDGLWVASVAGIRGCHTQGRTIEQARERAREAIQAALDLSRPYGGKLVDDVRLPKAIKKVVATARDARVKATVADRAASEGSRRAIAALTRIGLSLRDAGELLGVSRQRAQKLAS